jgi:hypothetical protein
MQTLKIGGTLEQAKTKTNNLAKTLLLILINPSAIFAKEKVLGNLTFFDGDV